MEDRRTTLSASGRVAAAASLALGFTGVLYWLPALFGARPAASGEGHPVAFIQRVASMALDQYTPSFGILIPILGALFTLASLVQIPAAIGALLGQERGRVALRVVACIKVGLYVASGLLLGLAIFSSVRPGDPPWTFSALNWLANLAMIAFYGWVLVALRDSSEGPSEGEELDEEEGAAADEEPLPSEA